MKGIVCIGFLLLFVTVSWATPPLLINYQGELRFPDGTLYPDGDYTMRFELFTVSTGGTAIYTELRDSDSGQQVAVTNSLFSVAIGEVESLTTSLFADHAELWLEVAVDTNDNDTIESNEVFAPRERIVSAPYSLDTRTISGYTKADLDNEYVMENQPNAVTSAMVNSQTADDGEVLAADGSGGAAWQIRDDGVPAGMIAFFAGNCPPGWSEYEALQGRFLVGVPPGGDVEGTLGDPMANLTNPPVPAHTHGVGTYTVESGGAHSHGSGSLVTNEAGGHTHSIDLTTSENGEHNHAAGTLETSEAGNHRHSYDRPASAIYCEGPNDRLVGYTRGSANTGYAGDHTHDITGDTASSGAHTHAVSGNTASGGAHPHTISGNTASGGAHTHDLSGDSAETGGDFPYIQLRACQKV